MPDSQKPNDWLSNDWLSMDKALFLLALLSSLIAWSANGLISELSQRTLVQYTTSKKDSGTAGQTFFIVQVRNLSAKEPVEGANFVIKPKKGKEEKPLLLINGAIGKINFPKAIILEMNPVSGSLTEGAEFFLRVLPPGAVVEFVVKYSTPGDAPRFYANYKKPKESTNGGTPSNYKMRLISSQTLEAWIVRNQVIIFIVLIGFSAFLLLSWFAWFILLKHCLVARKRGG